MIKSAPASLLGQGRHGEGDTGAEARVQGQREHTVTLRRGDIYEMEVFIPILYSSLSTYNNKLVTTMVLNGGTGVGRGGVTVSEK